MAHTPREAAQAPASDADTLPQQGDSQPRTDSSIEREQDHEQESGGWADLEAAFDEEFNDLGDEAAAASGSPHSTAPSDNASSVEEGDLDAEAEALLAEEGGVGAVAGRSDTNAAGEGTSPEEEAPASKRQKRAMSYWEDFDDLLGGDAGPATGAALGSNPVDASSSKPQQDKCSHPSYWAGMCVLCGAPKPEEPAHRAQHHDAATARTVSPQPGPLLPSAPWGAVNDSQQQQQQQQWGTLQATQAVNIRHLHAAGHALEVCCLML
jgi:hypothetical protein